jgi:hypothetical protein
MTKSPEYSGSNVYQITNANSEKLPFMNLIYATPTGFKICFAHISTNITPLRG